MTGLQRTFLASPGLGMPYLAIAAHAVMLWFMLLLRPPPLLPLLRLLRLLRPSVPTSTSLATCVRALRCFQGQPEELP